MLLGIDTNLNMVIKMMEGIEKAELPAFEKTTLSDMVDSEYPFVIDPMPNLYFTRDPFATIGSGISLNHMRTVTRNRETIFAKYIFLYHPSFKDQEIPRWYDRTEKTAIEGGDELILSKDVLAIGISERTDAASIEKLAKKVFDVNISNGTSDITPNANSVIKYLFRLLVLKKPSTIKKIKMGKAILPKIENELDTCNNNPSPLSIGIIKALFV